MTQFELPIYWKDHEDIAMALYEKFGDDFGESKIYRIRFTELMQWVLEIPNFKGTKEECNEGVALTEHQCRNQCEATQFTSIRHAW